MSTTVRIPYPVFIGLDGTALQAGRLFFGAPSGNPVTEPVSVYWDSARTQEASQPVLTLNGMPSRNGTVANLYLPTGADASLLVEDAKGRQVFYQKSLASGGDPSPVPAPVVGYASEIVVVPPGTTVINFTSLNYTPGANALIGIGGGFVFVAAAGDFIENSPTVITLTESAPVSRTFTFFAGVFVSTTVQKVINARFAGTMTGAASWSDEQTFTGGLKLANADVADPLILDWYFEGTFTPVAEGSLTAGTGTYVTQAGTFTRVGNLVTFSITMAWGAHTGTGKLRVGGLPYGGVVSAPCGAGTAVVGGFSTESYVVAASIDAVTDRIVLTRAEVDTTAAPGMPRWTLEEVDLGGLVTSQVRVQGQYFV